MILFITVEIYFFLYIKELHVNRKFLENFFRFLLTKREEKS